MLDFILTINVLSNKLTIHLLFRLINSIKRNSCEKNITMYTKMGNGLKQAAEEIIEKIKQLEIDYR